jgi:hypothetical protein
MLTRLGLGVMLGCWILCASPAALASWSAPALLGGCARASSQAPPLVVFPSSQPQARSGAGALLWTGPAGCRERIAGATPAGTSSEVLAAPLGPSGLPGPGRALNAGAGGPAEVIAAAGTALGQVLALGDGALAEGSSPGLFATPLPLDGPARPVAVASGYLGDTAVLSTVRERRARWALALRVQRHYSSTPAAPRLLVVGTDRPSALAVAMDYRSDVLVVWVAGAASDARLIPAGGAPGRVERVGAGADVAELRALISDDGRAIVAWREQASVLDGRARTSIESSISGPGMVFARATPVESFADLPGLILPPGSLQLTRLSSEAVMIAWTGVSAGRYVVRASPVSLRRGVWAPVTVSPPDAREALLAELVPGPRAEVLALWSAAPRLPDGALDIRHRAIFAAWGHYAGHGEAVFAPAEALAPPGPNGTPAAAFDPDNDRALAAWVQSIGSPRIVYAQRAAGPPALAAPARAAPARGVRAQGTPASSPRPTAVRGPPQAPARASDIPHGSGHRSDVLAALALLLVAAAAAYRGIGRRRGWIGARRT